jgi:hypothetical protein
LKLQKNEKFLKNYILNWTFKAYKLSAFLGQAAVQRPESIFKGFLPLPTQLDIEPIGQKQH